MLWSTGGRRPGLLGLVDCCGLGIAACVWVAWNQSALGDQYGILAGPLQTGIAVVLLVAAIDMARRSVGWPMPSLAAVALLYGLFGEHIPGEFGHAGVPLASFLGTLTIAEGGLWGSLTGVSVSIVAIFVIFGAVLNAGQAGAGFMNVAAIAAGRLSGRRGQGVDHLVGAVRLDLRFGIGQRRVDRRDHPAGDDPAGLSEEPCRRGRGRRLVRRTDHAAADGRRRLRHGRAHRGALRGHHGGGAAAGAALFLRRLGGHQCLRPTLRTAAHAGQRTPAAAHGADHHRLLPGALRRAVVGHVRRRATRRSTRPAWASSSPPRC